MSAARLAALLPVAAGVFFTYPLLPLAPALGPDFAPPGGDGPGLGIAAMNTLRLATLSAGCALAPALWLGMMLERRSWGGRRALAATLLLLFLLPGYLVAAGWQILLGSTALRSAAALRDALLGWPGLVGLAALKGLPVATLAARAGWAARRPGLDDATLLHVRGRGRRALLSARPLLPFAAAAALIVFVEATQDYGLAATLGARLRLPLLVSEVYASPANWPISWARAAQAGDLLVLIALLPVAVRLLLPRSAPPLLDRGRASAPRPASRGERWLGWGALALLLGLGCGVPLLALAADAASPEAGGLPDGAAHALLASLLYAFVASLAALCLACALAANRGGSRLRGALASLPMVNMAVPGIVLGAAEVIAFNGPPLPLTGTPLAWAWSLAFCRLFFELPLAQMLAPAGGEPVGHGVPGACPLAAPFGARECGAGTAAGHGAARRPGTLSGGQQQRVALARALATGSDLLLLDEPLSSLDGAVRDRVRPLIRDMLRRDGRAALFVSHDRLDAWRVADRILVLEHGTLSQCDTPRAMYASPATATAARCMGAEGRFRVWGADAGHVVTDGGCRVPATCIGLAPGARGMALAHPDGVCIGLDQGLPAIRRDCVFEAGLWRTRWQVGCSGDELLGLHRVPPPERAALLIDPAKLFAFPAEPD